LGYEFLKDLNPHIDWTAGTLHSFEMETVQAIIAKRIADVKQLSGKKYGHELTMIEERKRKKNKIRN
jgi:hypothetical protein